jgi:hypothetical protein
MVTFTFFHFKDFKNIWWAFTQMGRRPFKAATTEGVSFVKLLGTGGGNGFSIRPDFNQYALMIVWDNEMQMHDFFKQNPVFQLFKNKAFEYITIFLKPIMAHGQWDNVALFNTIKSDNIKPNPRKPIAVLTRASIKKNKLIHFWRYVPRVSRSINFYSENKIFSVGIGELPLVEQATFSLWKSGEAMMDYAYKNPYHAEVIKKTRELGWYSEELFARFTVTDIIGTENFRHLSLSDLCTQILDENI